MSKCGGCSILDNGTSFLGNRLMSLTFRTYSAFLASKHSRTFEPAGSIHLPISSGNETGEEGERGVVCRLTCSVELGDVFGREPLGETILGGLGREYDG